MNDFGVKYFTKDHIQHLLDALGENYTYTVDWEGQYYCGLKLNWSYAKRYVDISIPEYIHYVLSRFHHPKPKLLKYSPHKHIPIRYGSKTRQYVSQLDNSPLQEKNALTMYNKLHDSCCIMHSQLMGLCSQP